MHDGMPYGPIQGQGHEPLKVSIPSIFRLDALALNVIATGTWLAGWLGGWVAVCHSRYCIKTTKPILKLFGPSGRPMI